LRIFLPIVLCGLSSKFTCQLLCKEIRSYIPATFATNIFAKKFLYFTVTLEKFFANLVHYLRILFAGHFLQISKIRRNDYPRAYYLRIFSVSKIRRKYSFMRILNKNPQKKPHEISIFLVVSDIILNIKAILLGTIALL